MNFRALALGAAIGFVFALSPSCGPQKTACNATNCAGCCDSTGTCQTSSDSTCGASGAACTACSAGSTCSGGVCSTPTGGGGGSGASCQAQGLCPKPSGGCGTDPCANGCCVPNDPFGKCIVTPNPTLCGKLNAACTACNTAGGQTCVSVTGGSECQGGSTGGGTGGGTGTVDAGVVGNACADDAACGAGYFCKKNTGIKTDGGTAVQADGGTVTGMDYPGGFCTRPCTASTAAQCGFGNSCLNYGAGGNVNGEVERLCAKTCDVLSQNCRAEYTCVGTGATGTCFMDPAIPAGVTGNPCTTDNQCGNNLSQFCEGGPGSNFPELTDGFCTATCEPATKKGEPFSTNYCGSDSVCVDFGGSSTQGDFLNLCNKLCDLPDGGNIGGIQASCRTGQICQPVFGTATAPVLDTGICAPDCNNSPGTACSAAYPCVDAGTAFYGQCCQANTDGGAPIESGATCFAPVILYLSGLPYEP